MSIMRTFNKAVSKAINWGSNFYTSMFGSESFTPESVITVSSDFNCGGLANELEYLRVVSNYYTQSFDLDISEGENLEALTTAFLRLPRRNRSEDDDIYRRRYRAIANAKVNPRRTTKWAIIDAIQEFGIAADKIQILEFFDTRGLYFELRIEGAVDYATSIFMNSYESGAINQNFIGGAGVGQIITFLGDIIDRIKASGVDFDVAFINQLSFVLISDCSIGAIQFYKSSIANIKAASSFTLMSDATVA